MHICVVGIYSMCVYDCVVGIYVNVRNCVLGLRVCVVSTTLLSARNIDCL